MRGGKGKGTWNVVNDGRKREQEEITPKRREEMLDAPCNTRFQLRPRLQSCKNSRKQKFQKLTNSVSQ